MTSQVRFRPQIGLLEQRALMSALPTVTALRASTTSAALGQSVAFTATVSDFSAGGATPNGGTVSFNEQGGTIDSATLVDGAATFTTSSLAAGANTIAAFYGGTAEFAASSTGLIVNAAGNHTAGYEGDNGPATAAELHDPFGVAVDSAGDLFIADAYNNVIREVIKATGDIITVVGNGTAGYKGDGGPATAAELDYPIAVAVDSAGDLFIADGRNNVVREVVKATGDIIAFAGNGTAGYKGDGGLATAAELNDQFGGLAVDSAGDLFIADIDNNVVREVLKATGDIINVAGNGKAGYSGDGGLATAAELNSPLGLAFDSAGDLFISDSGNNVVREVKKATGDIVTFAGNGTAGYSGNNGPATAAELNDPFGGLAFDSAGDLFIPDFGNYVVREVVKATGDIITVTGNGIQGYSGNNRPAIEAELAQPVGLTVDFAGDVFVADWGNAVRFGDHAVGDSSDCWPVGAPSPTTAAHRLDDFGDRWAVGHVYRRIVSDLRCRRGHSERGDGHLQRTGRSARQRDAGRRCGDVHNLELGGGHEHRLRHPTAVVPPILAPSRPGHERDCRRQRHRRLRGRRRACVRRRA